MSYDRLIHPLMRENGALRRATWDETRQSETTTIFSCCDLTPHAQDNKIAKVTSPHDNPLTKSNLYAKGRFGYGYV
ncbi:hypothetical protein ABZ897_13075 [Nonomuraea sp. NPDC046802]|uniref:hypothetical protein n=1 Tax=Nonomuraea sp. NPDC046802 TaxID=3154919 RepID=UPI0033E8A044